MADTECRWAIQAAPHRENACIVQYRKCMRCAVHKMHAQCSDRQIKCRTMGICFPQAALHCKLLLLFVACNII